MCPGLSPVQCVNKITCMQLFAQSPVFVQFPVLCFPVVLVPWHGWVSMSGYEARLNLEWQQYFQTHHFHSGAVLILIIQLVGQAWESNVITIVWLATPVHYQITTYGTGLYLARKKLGSGLLMTSVDLANAPWFVIHRSYSNMKLQKLLHIQLYIQLAIGQSTSESLPPSVK